MILPPLVFPALTFNDEVVEGALGADVAAGVDGDAGGVEVEGERVGANHPLDAAVTLNAQTNFW